MGHIIAIKNKTFAAAFAYSPALLGCSFLILSSFIKIPFYPVPFTMQTFVIGLLGLTQSPWMAFCSVSSFLLCGTVGLPVFGGISHPGWLFGNCGGYLIAFPLAASLISYLKDKCPKIAALLFGQCLIYLLGMAWLVPFFGLKTAFLKGVLFFIPSGLLKSLMALGTSALLHKWRG